MNEKHELKVGETALLRIGRNGTKVKILAPMADDTAFMVKSLSSGKVFAVPKSRLVSIEPVEPKPETKPTGKMSLMDAAVAVLKESGGPMNTREMVKAAAGKGYWTPTACKTPEQTLYASISREIKTKDRPRIVRSDAKGKFTIAG